MYMYQEHHRFESFHINKSPDPPFRLYEQNKSGQRNNNNNIGAKKSRTKRRNQIIGCRIYRIYHPHPRRRHPRRHHHHHRRQLWINSWEHQRSHSDPHWRVGCSVALFVVLIRLFGIARNTSCLRFWYHCTAWEFSCTSQSNTSCPRRGGNRNRRRRSMRRNMRALVTMRLIPPFEIWRKHTFLHYHHPPPDRFLRCVLYHRRLR